MKLIKPFFDIIEQPPGLEGIYKIIEIAGRTCYKSSDKITNDSADKFVEMLIKRNHTAMLEHGTVYLKQHDSILNTDRCIQKYIDNKYSIVNNDTVYGIGQNTTFYITTNYRVLVENDWLEDLQYQCEPTEFHEKRISVRFTCDRGVSHEFVRHRVFSFAQESTRYCNYSKDKFGNELTFIIPCWLDLEEGSYLCGNEEDYTDIDEFYAIHVESDFRIEGRLNFSHTMWLRAMDNAEKDYRQLIEKSWKPQQARSILPNSLKTELVMTGTVEQWKGFFKLRCNADAHPQARELAQPLEQEFFKLGLLN